MMDTAALWLAAIAGAIALASAYAYSQRRRALDALLVIGCALLFALAQCNFTIPAAPVALADATGPDAAAALQLRVDGDGLPAARWRDLPARTLRWSTPATPALALRFPATAPPGRPLRVQAEGSGVQVDRVELLAENGRPLAEGRGGAVQWVPLAAERVTLTARVYDRDGKLLAHGPVPIAVQAPRALRVRGRFAAPSFDVRVLEHLLADSAAVLDWQVTLGRGISRTVATPGPDTAPDVMIADAAWIEHAGPGTRRALWDRVAAGMPLLILGGDAADSGFWQRELGMAFKTPGSAPFVPMPRAPWLAGAAQTWARPWEAGRITWLAAADWHRRAIADKTAVAAWVQDVLDAAGANRAQEGRWRAIDPMPLPGRRLEVCADDARGTVRVARTGQVLTWQRRSDRAGSACVALWPQAPGWMQLESGAVRWSVYVYDPSAWPLWQAAQRRQATARYALRTPSTPPMRRLPIPAWPFLLGAMLCALLLWWRERRA
jgi:hypothetical protein